MVDLNEKLAVTAFKTSAVLVFCWRLADGPSNPLTGAKALEMTKVQNFWAPTLAMMMATLNQTLPLFSGELKPF